MATSHPLCIIAVTLCAKAIETGINSLIDQVVFAMFLKETMVSDFGTSEKFFIINSLNLPGAANVKHCLIRDLFSFPQSIRLYLFL